MSAIQIAPTSPAGFRLDIDYTYISSILNIIDLIYLVDIEQQNNSNNLCIGIRVYRPVGRMM